MFTKVWYKSKTGYVHFWKKKTALLQEIRDILDIKSLNILKRDNTSSSLLQCYIFDYIQKRWVGQIAPIYTNNLEYVIQKHDYVMSKYVAIMQLTTIIVST